MQNARVQGVAQLGGKCVLHQPAASGGILDREEHFDPAEKIPRHPVGAACEERGVAVVFEIVNARVFEETPDDAAHADVFGETLHPRHEAADAAHDEIDLHAGL